MNQNELIENLKLLQTDESFREVLAIIIANLEGLDLDANEWTCVKLEKSKRNGIEVDWTNLQGNKTVKLRRGGETAGRFLGSENGWRYNFRGLHWAHQVFNHHWRMFKTK